MADQTIQQKRIAAIVPAYNEAARIGAVLGVLTTFPGFSEIIVVDDGSSDQTAQIAAAFPVQLIRQTRNKGKGSAMDEGVKHTGAEIIFFCDADVRGLTHHVIEATVTPVRNGDCDMVIAMRNRKIYFLRIVLAIIPLLGGERALTRALWERVPAAYKERFKIEAALNFYARHYGKGFRYKVFYGLTQTIKERKYGIVRGFMGRARMFGEVISAQAALQMTALPRHVQTGRAALANVAAAAAGMLLGIALTLFAYRGPGMFTGSPELISFAARLAGALGTNILAAAGIGIAALNMLFIALNVKNIRFLLTRPPRAQRIE